MSALRAIDWSFLSERSDGHPLPIMCSGVLPTVGARIAALRASTMGERIYRRIGYETVRRYPTIVRF